MTDIDRSDELLDWYAEENPDGAGLLDDVESFVRRFLALPISMIFLRGE